jgi:hypothetical protein
VAVDFCPKQSGWLINQLGVPQFNFSGEEGEAFGRRRNLGRVR